MSRVKNIMCNPQCVTSTQIEFIDKTLNPTIMRLQALNMNNNNTVMTQNLNTRYHHRDFLLNFLKMLTTKLSRYLKLFSFASSE